MVAAADGEVPLAGRPPLGDAVAEGALGLREPAAAFALVTDVTTEFAEIVDER